MQTMPRHTDSKHYWQHTMRMSVPGSWEWRPCRLKGRHTAERRSLQGRGRGGQTKWRGQRKVKEGREGEEQRDRNRCLKWPHKVCSLKLSDGALEPQCMLPWDHCSTDEPHHDLACMQLASSSATQHQPAMPRLWAVVSASCVTPKPLAMSMKHMKAQVSKNMRETNTPNATQKEHTSRCKHQYL